MSFLYPWVFWFSALISIPIIIHLFYFRRYKVVLFSNNAMLDNVIKQSKSQQRIRNLLILLFRIIFILSLVFAFAQPFIAKDETKKSNSGKILALYIDNSFSMSQEGEKTSILDESKSNAIAMIQSMPYTTRYILCYHGMDFSVSRLFSAEEAQKKINEIKPSAVALTWSEVFELIDKAKAILTTSSPVEYAFFTDGQKYAVDYQKWKKQKTNLTLFYAKGASMSNLSIDSIWTEQPNHILGKSERITANIHNYSNDDLNNIPVQLFINDTLKSVSTLNIKAQSIENVVFNYTNQHSGWIKGKVEMSDFPVIFDNNFYFTYPVYSTIQVAVIGNSNVEYFKAFFDSDSSLRATYFSGDNIAYSRLSEFQVIILNQLKGLSSGLWNSLKTFVSNGGTVLIIPDNDWSLESINAFYKEMGWIYIKPDTIQLNMQIPSFEQDFFSDIFSKKEERAKLPWAKNIVVPELQESKRYDVLLKFENGKNAALRINHEKGQWYLLGFSLNKKYSNFVSHPLFVAMLHRIIQLAVPSQALFYTISQNTTLQIPLDSTIGEKGLQFFNSKTKQSYIPLQQILFNECKLSLKEGQIDDGIYDVLSEHQNVGCVAFNYNRKESEMKFYSSEQLSNFLKEKDINTTVISTTNFDEIKTIIHYQNQGLVLWKWFVLAAILCIIAEMAIIRFWKA